MGATATTIRTFQLEKIVEKILLHNNSVICLIKNSSTNKYSELDISMIASAARNIMECTNYYFYVAERNISKDEMEFRYSLSNLNYYYNMIDIMKKLDFPTSCFRARMLEHGKNMEIGGIKNSKTFQSTDKNTQNYLLSGRKQTFNMRERNILSKNKESAIYNILSNNIHSLYIGLGSNSIRGSAPYNSYIGALTMLMIASEICIIYTAHVLKDYLLLRKRLNNRLLKEEKIIIKRFNELSFAN